MKRFTAGILLALILATLSTPAYAVKKESIWETARRWEHSRYCQGWWGRNSWFGDLVASLSGC